MAWLSGIQGHRSEQRGLPNGVWWLRCAWSHAEMSRDGRRASRVASTIGRRWGVRF